MLFRSARHPRPRLISVRTSTRFFTISLMLAYNVPSTVLSPPPRTARCTRHRRPCASPSRGRRRPSCRCGSSSTCSGSSCSPRTPPALLRDVSPPPSLPQDCSVSALLPSFFPLPLVRSDKCGSSRLMGSLPTEKLKHVAIGQARLEQHEQPKRSRRNQSAKRSRRFIDVSQRCRTNAVKLDV